MGECEDRIGELHGRKVGSILDFGVEGKSRESDFVRVFEETQQAIARAEQDSRIPFLCLSARDLFRSRCLRKSAATVSPPARIKLLGLSFQSASMLFCRRLIIQMSG